MNECNCDEDYTCTSCLKDAEKVQREMFDEYMRYGIKDANGQTIDVREPFSRDLEGNVHKI